MRLSVFCHRSRVAFTLVETIVVFLIIAVLAAIGAVAYNSVTDNSKLRAAQAELTQFEQSAQALAVLDGRSTYTQADFTTAVTDQPASTVGAGLGAADAVLAAAGWLPAFGAAFPGDGHTIAGGFTGTPTPGSQLSMASWVPGVGCAFSTGTPGGQIETWGKKGLAHVDCVPANASRNPATGGTLLTAPPMPTPRIVHNGDGTTTVSVPTAPAATSCDFYVSGMYVATADCQTGWTDPSGGSDGGNYTVVQHPAGDTSTAQAGWNDAGGTTLPPAGSTGDSAGSTGQLDETAPVTAPTTITWTPGDAPAGSVITVVSYPAGGGTPAVVSDNIDPSTGYVVVTPPSGGAGYQVVAHDPSAGWNDPGATPLPVVTAPTQTPTMPSSGGSGGTPPAASVSGTDVTLAWDGVGSTPTAPLTGYRVYSAVTSAGPFVQVAQLDASTTAWTDHVGSGGVQVCFTLTAYGPGGESAQSGSVCATTITTVAPGVPSGLTATAGDTQATLVWSPVGSTGTAPVDGYRVYRNGATTAVHDGTTTSFVDTGLVNGTQVCYTVTAYGAGGESSASAQQCVTPNPPAPMFTAVAAGDSHTCAIAASGGAWCWGYNATGQLGNNSTTYSKTAVRVAGLGAGATAIAAGDQHTCAIDAAAALWCWGANNFGQLGDGTTTERNTPVKVSGLSAQVTAVAARTYDTCAVDANGVVWCWGFGGSGQLGNGTTANSATPVRVLGLPAKATSIAVGQYYACELDVNRDIWCWGQDDYGQLGNGTTTTRVLTPVKVSGMTAKATAIAAHGADTCAIDTNATVWCWGQNRFGELGDGTTAERSTPAKVSGVSGVTSVVIGQYDVCAIGVGGSAWCWGYNGNGQIGDGTTTDRYAPRAVLGLGSGTTSIVAGGYFACATDTAGGVWCWGNNGSGQLGDGTTTQRTAPVAVLPPTS